MPMAFASTRDRRRARAIARKSRGEVRRRHRPTAADAAAIKTSGRFRSGCAPTPGRPPSIWFRSVTPGYFGSMRMRIVAGRGFTADDRAGAAPVGIVNEEAARNVLARRESRRPFARDGRRARARAMTIIGIAASVHHDGPNQPYKTELYSADRSVAVSRRHLILEPSRDVASLGALFGKRCTTSIR